jgi:hypothetical protein
MIGEGLDDAAAPVGVVPQRNLTIQDVQRRRMRNRRVRAATGLFRSKRLFSWFLNRALVRACPEQHGFFVPTAWAQACLKDRLRTAVPTLEIRQVMFDWLQVGGRSLHASDYFIGGGDWSVFLRSIEKSAIMQEAIELIEKDMAWSKTEVYRAMLQAIERGAPLRRQQMLLDSEEAIARYFQRFHRLAESIRTRGMLRPADVDRPAENLGEREIGIALDCDGSLVKLPGGQHRVAIARAIGLPRIPVEVRLIHAGLVSERSREKGKRPLEAVLDLISDFNNAVFCHSGESRNPVNSKCYGLRQSPG